MDCGVTRNGDVYIKDTTVYPVVFDGGGLGTKRGVDDDGAAISMMIYDVGVDVGVEGVREIGCMWNFL